MAPLWSRLHAAWLARTARRPTRGAATTVLLTTTGRRTGRTRRTPVQVWDVDGRRVVIGAANGSETPPAWWLNLEAQPEVLVDGVPTVAFVLDEPARADTWARLVRIKPRLLGLEHRAGRPFGLAVLTPRP